MRRSGLRWSAAIAVVGAVVLLPLAAAWACLGLAGLTTSSGNVQPGGTATLTGVEFGKNPVELRVDSLTGPVLATVVPKGGRFTQDVTLPADLPAGQHVIVATESAVTPDGQNNGAANGVPARSLIQVGTPAPAPAPAPPLSLASNSGIGALALALIALATAGGGLLLAGGASLLASRRRGEPAAVKA